jgi:hypothetical protein
MLAYRVAVPLVLVGALAACAGPADDRGTPSAGASAAAPSDLAAAWECPELQPGRPTTAEQRAFVEEVGALATRAEERYGVPAAALTAMAILESGYGQTQLAQNANNLLGWKSFPGVDAGGRDSWGLECPGRGVIDRFVVFRDRADGIDYVSSQLASSDNYRADTERYRRDRASDADVVEAVNRWVDGIADPYSSDPEAFRSAVRRIMSDSYETVEGTEGTLYRLSEAASPPRAQSAEAAAR